MSADSSSHSERFQSVTTVLIAIVSTAIALVASQTAVVSGNVAEAQQNGVLAKINLERVDGGSRVQLARNVRAYDIYRFNRSLDLLSRTYAAEAEDAQNIPYAVRLRQESASMRENRDLAFDSMNSGYLTTDEDGNYAGFDEEAFLSDHRQDAEIYQHLDLQYEDNFQESNTLRVQALELSTGLIVLFISVMFLTWAQLTRSVLRWVWLAAGVLVALGAGAGFLLLSILNRLGAG
ncbi:MAG: hypothetical protein ACRDH2_11485 [Anaerolineales bacterium]